MNLARQRSIFDALPEPAFLVLSVGTILDANKAARQAHGDLLNGHAVDLSALAIDSPGRLVEYLRRCSGSADSVPGSVTLIAERGGQIRYRCSGSVIEPGSGNQPATILLRCVPGEGEFRVLTNKIAELNKEVLLRRRTQLNLEHALAEKEVLIRELHHRVKNNLQLLLSLFSLGERREADERVRAKLRDARLRVQSMATVQKLLYQSESFAAVNIANFLSELCAGLRAAFILPHIQLHADVVPATLSLDAAVPVGLIVNELVTNALRHAFPDLVAGEIRVTLRKDDSTFRLSVEDNGTGLDEQAAQGHSGLMLVRGLAQQLRGTCTLESSRPARWEIAFVDHGRTPAGLRGSP